MKKVKYKETKKAKAERMKERKRLFAKRKSVICDCQLKKSQLRDRSKYGTCHCDSYNLNHSLALIIANSLYQYIATAKSFIIREDFELIEKHANAIKAYATADSWDELDQNVDKRYKYSKITKDWREAMFWLTENWQGLWW